MGNPRSPTPAAPAGPQAVDPGAAINSYLNGFADPGLQQRIIGMEGQYRPQYTGLNQRDIQNTLLGVNPGSPDGHYGTLDMQNWAAQRAQQTNQSLLDQQRGFDLSQLQQYGPQMAQAYMAANPGLASAIGRAEGMAGPSGQTNSAFNQMGSFLGGGPQGGATITPQSVGFDPIKSGGELGASQVNPMMIGAERIAAGQVGTSDAQYGALGSSLYGQALQANQPTALTGALGQQGLRMATNPGQLTPEEIRAATQGSREKYAASGRLDDNAGITGEALARAGASRDRMFQDLSAAQGINAQQLGAQQMGQQFAQGVLGQNLGLQQFNIQNRLGADQFNVDSSLRASLANQATGLQASMANQGASLDAQRLNQAANMEAGRFNILNSQNVQGQNQAAQMQAALANQAYNYQGQLANRDFTAQQAQQYFNNLGQYGLLGQQQGTMDRNYALQLAGLYGGTSNAVMDLLGRPAAGMGYGLQQQQLGMQQAGITGPTLFDPNAGVNLALQNNANLANYNASIYGAQAGIAGANAQATGALKAGMIQGGMQAAGSIIGGAIACWVARSVYGEDDLRWLSFRRWLFTKAPARRLKRYLENGPKIAAWLDKRPGYKARVRAWMDTKIAAA
jgi:hypothetical protein